MNEQPYKVEHLQEYTGILTSPDARGEKFQMELKVEDNPIMDRWAQKDKSAIELEFRYNGGPSTMFFHNRQTCENYLQRVDCNECERIQNMYDIFASKLSRLQFGDTFRINAALINNKQSVLPAEIHNFERYQPLLVACTEYRLRLDDTPEGIKKKHEREQQRLQQEREEEERRREEEEKRKIEADKAKRREKWDRLEQRFAKYPYTIAIGIAIIGTSLTYEGLRFIVKKIFSLILPN